MSDTMDFVIITYFLAFCGAVFLLLCYRFRSVLVRLRDFLRFPILKYLTYPVVVGGWNRAELVLLMIYLTMNVLCLWFRSPSLLASGNRAGSLSLINLIFQSAALHLDSLTNSLGLRWCAVRHLHGSIGIVVILLLAFHVVAAIVSSTPFPLNVPRNMWAVVVGLFGHASRVERQANDQTAGSIHVSNHSGPFDNLFKKKAVRRISPYSSKSSDCLGLWYLDPSGFTAVTPSFASVLVNWHF
jgi:hypothetical protein